MLDGLEQDECDESSVHVLVRTRATGQVLGTVRLILPDERSARGFPMERVCEDWVLAPLPRSITAEVSCFAVTRDRTSISQSASVLLRLYLTQGLIAFNGELGITHWCAIMERTLLRLLRSTSTYFLPVGPTEYHGIRRPAIFALADGFERMRRENREIWSFLTSNGRAGRRR